MKKNLLLKLQAQSIKKELGLFITLLFFVSGSVVGQSTANYTFSTNATGSLAADANSNAVDMTTGTTQLLGTAQDDVASAVTNIGFTFTSMGVSFTQFSINSNGAMALGATAVGTSGTTNGGTSTSVFIAPFGADQKTNATNSKIHYKLIGTSPNRSLVIEWSNMLINYQSTSTNGDGTYQVRLYETTGVIEFVYGAMNVGTVFTTAPIIGFSTGTTAGKIASITYSSNANTTNGTAFIGNTYTTGAITNLNSATDGSRRVYKYTPPVTSANPTTLSFTSITSSTTTPNWVDNSTNEIGFVVTRANDAGFTTGVVTTSVATTTAAGTGTTYTSIQSGLMPSTTYYYKIQAINEAQASSGLTGTQATTAAAIYYWVGATGAAWGTAANWNTLANNTGTTRGTALTTDVLIVDGAGTTAGVATVISVDVASFSVGQLKITNNTACTLQSSAVTTRVITITGGPNDDFVIENGSTLNLNHTANAIQFIFSTGTTGDISGTVNFAGSTSNLITTTGGFVTVNSTGVVNIGTTAINLVGTAATLSFANGSNCNVTGATTGAYPIPLATWAANSTVTLSGTATSTTTATNKNQAFGNFVVNLPSLTAGTLSFWTSSTTASIQGNLIITSTGTGVFRALTSGTLTVNGNLTINGGNFNHTGSTGIFTVLGNTTISSGANLDLSTANSGTIFNQRGATFTNNGTITTGTSIQTLSFYSPTNAAMTFAGSGSITASFNSISVQTTGGLTISHTNLIPTLRVNCFGGTITGSGKLAIGIGSTSSSVIQIGAIGLTTSAGGFDVSPTWNLGSGGLSILYSPELGTRTTGYEIPPTRTVTNITVQNNGLTVAGGNLNVSSTLTMTAGVITSSLSNVLSLGTSTVSGTLAITSPSSTNMIVGPFARTFALNRNAVGTYDATTHYPVGKGSTYSPIWVDPTTTSGGAVIITSESFTSNGGSAGTGVTNLSTSNWSAQATTGSANLTSARVRVSDTGVATTSKLLQAVTATGSFEGVAGGSVCSGASGTITSNADLTTYTGYFAYGDLASCTTPSSQPTNFSAAINTTSIIGSFTAASGSPTGYLVVRGASGFTPTPPTDQTLYTAGAALGTGTIIGSYINATSFTSSSLTAATTYDYYIYAYNNSGCAGPSYNTTSPLLGTITTCVAAPTSSVATSVTALSFSANWVAVANATSYVLDVSTSSTFASFVSGYQALNVGNFTTYAVSNLLQNTTYYYRVRAVMSGCTTNNSSTITVLTYRTTPWSENFGTATTAPTGWTATGLTTGILTGTVSSSIFVNLYSTNVSNTLILPTFSSIQNGVKLWFSYTVMNYNSGSQPTVNTASGWGSFQVQVSTNGTTWTNLGAAISDPTTGYTVISQLDLSSYVGQTIQIRIVSTWTTGDWYISFDDFALQAPCSGPSSPTSMVFGNVGTGTVTATYTANAVAPSGYVVVRFPNGTTPTAPSNSTTYVAGDLVGSNGGVVTNVLSSTALGYTAVGLSPNTSYDFYLYPFNNTSCTNAPAYGSPLMGTISTATCPTYSSTLTIDSTATPVSGSVYNTLTAAILELSGCGVTQPMVIELANNYFSSAETFPIVLRSVSGASSTNTITIRPASNVFTSVAITGASSGSQIFNIDGGNYWVIDGRAGGTGTSKNLTIENTGALATGTSAVRLINGAQYNVIKYCTLRSATTSTNSAAVVAFSSSTASVGNSFNTVTYCNIDCNPSVGNNSTAGIASNPTGTSLTDARFNNSNIITYNNIYGFYNSTSTSHWGSGILLSNGYNSDWTISNNSIYQPTTMSAGTGTADCFGINVNGVYGGNFTISDNYIGGSGPNCSGTMILNPSTTANTFRGLHLSFNSTSPSTVSNNTISNISHTSTTTSSQSNAGISFINGAGTISGNIISNIIFNSSANAYFNAIIAGNGSSTGYIDHNGLITISNNNISGITIGGAGASAFIGIRTETIGTNPTLTNSQYSITGNVIGSTSTSNSISSTTNGFMYGIYSNSLSALNNTISNNTIANITSSNATATTNLVYGVYGFGTSLNTISSNSIYNLKSSYKTTTSPGVIGINSAATTAGQTISGNSIYNLTNTETAATTSIAGISYSGTTTGTNSIEKNKIYNLMLSTSSTSGAINGITISGYPITASNNMVRLGIASDASSINTGYSIFGIKDAVTAGNSSFYFNSIYVGSTSVSGVTSNTYAFSSAGTSNTRIIRNNIFSNVRSGGTTGKHYALGLAGVSSLTNNNNDYFTGGSSTLAINGSTDIASLSALQTATSQDASSVSTNPNFIDATAATANLKINNSSSSLLESTGANISGITMDIEGDARPGPSGSSNGGAISSDIGADEFDGILGKPIITLTSTSPNLTTQCSSTARNITMNVITAGTLTAEPILNYSINGVAQTAINMTAGTGTLTSNGTWTATIPSVTPVNGTIAWSVAATNENTTSSYTGTSYSDAPNSGISANIIASNTNVCSNNTSTSLSSSFNTFTELFNGSPTMQFTLVTTTPTGSATQNTSYYVEGTSSVLFKAPSASSSVQFTQTNAISLVNIPTPTLTFSHICASEAAYDYGYVEYSTDNGTNWTPFPTSSYTGTATLKNSVVSFDKSSYTDWGTQFTVAASTPGTAPATSLWKNETITIPAIALTSTQFKIRFRYTTNSSNQYYGWLIDNLKISATPNYSWSDGTNVVGTTSTITPSPTATTTYTVSATFNNCPVTESKTITVSPLSVAGTPAGTTTICAGNSVTVSLSGYTGTIQWQQSLNGTSGWANVTGGSGATTDSYATPNLTVTTYYRAVVTSGACTSANSSTITITVNATTVAGTATAVNSNVCSGNGTTINLTGSTGTIQWQSSSSLNGTYSDISGATSASLATGNLTATSYYQAVVTSGVCSALTTSKETVTVNSLPTTYTVTGGGAYCSGGSGVAVGLDNSAVGVNYQLVRGGSTNVGSAVAGTGAAIAFGNQTTAGTYTVVATNATTTCTSTMTGNAVVAINALPTIALSYIDDVSPLATSFSISYTALTGSPTLYSITAVSPNPMTGFTAVSAATLGTSPISVTIPQSAAAEYSFNLTITNSNGCSNNYPFQFHVTALAHGTIGTDQTICSGATPAAFTSIAVASGSGTITYSWEQSTSAINSGYTAISSATSTTYAPGALTQTTYYKRVASNGLETSDSDPITITVNPNPTALVLTGSANCSGSLGTITSSASVSGVNYQLYNASNVAIGSVVAGTDSGLSWSSIAIATGYYVKATNATTTCVSANSNAVAVGTITDKTWIGTTNNSWNTASNWSCNSVPSTSDTIVISSGNPQLDTDFTVAGSLTISGTGTLTINSTKTLTISAPVNFGGKSVTIKSDANGTGAIGQVSGPLTNATNVTVERYIPAKRSWRALTSPVIISGSIYANWQEGGVGNTVNGFDIWSPNATDASVTTGGVSNSLMEYNSTSNTWSGITNTASTSSSSMLTADGKNKPFMAFPTGPFGTGNITTGQTATTIRATGTLLTGPQNYACLGTKYTLIGNPYASTLSIIDLLISINPAFEGNLWVWDPNGIGTNGVGAYNLFDAAAFGYANTTSSTFSSGSATSIQSGQAFFVKPTTDQTFTIQEIFKNSDTNNAVFGKQSNTQAEVIRVGIFKQINNVWTGRDGAMEVIFPEASATQTANKLSNGSENIAFTKNGNFFASEHHLPLVSTDTLNVRIWKTTAGANYKLKINTEQFTTTGLDATLQDLYTNTNTPLSLDGTAVDYPFTVTSDATSSGDRFRIVFSPTLGTHNFTNSSIKISPNPIIGDSFQVSLGSLSAGNYDYFITNSIGQEIGKGTITHNEQVGSNMVKMRENVAAGIYIVKIIGADKSVYTTKLIKQ